VGYPFPDNGKALIRHNAAGVRQLVIETHSAFWYLAGTLVPRKIARKSFLTVTPNPRTYKISSVHVTAPEPAVRATLTVRPLVTAHRSQDQHQPAEIAPGSPGVPPSFRSHSRTLGPRQAASTLLRPSRTERGVRVGHRLPLLEDDQVRLFIRSGFLVLANVVSAADLEALNAEVDRLVAEAPPPRRHVGNHFYWQAPASSPSFFDVLKQPRGILELARDVVGDDGVDVAFEQAQVALNIPPFDHRPRRPHIDGYQPGQSVPATFTLLASLFLNDQVSDNGGNLWVWPGTHKAHAAFFARTGPRGFAEAAGYPDIELPEPTQIRGRAGDVLLAHYLLGHNIGGNDESNRTRRALYWRLRTPGHVNRWAECLADPWADYPRIKPLASIDTGEAL
jgi:hypothetical protein